MSTSRASTRMLPLLGFTSPNRMLIRVDLPAPFSPNSPSTLPGGISIATSSSAATGPKRFEMWRIWIIRGTDEHLAGIDKNAAAIRLHQPKQNAHQGRFAGTVLSQQPQHPARWDIDRHIIERGNGAETL